MRARAVPKPQQAHGWLSTDGKFFGSQQEAAYYNALLVLREKLTEHPVISQLAAHEQEYITKQVLSFAQSNAEVLIEYCTAWKSQLTEAEPELIPPEPNTLTEETIVENLRDEPAARSKGKVGTETA